MTDDELQQFCNQRVRLKTRGEELIGTLRCGMAALHPYAPYAIETSTAGSDDIAYDAIQRAEDVESVDLVDEPVAEEIEEVIEETQTPA